MNTQIKRTKAATMPATGPITVAWEAAAALGEGALWSQRGQALYWVDILGRQLHRLSPATGARASWRFEQ